VLYFVGKQHLFDFGLKGFFGWTVLQFCLGFFMGNILSHFLNCQDFKERLWMAVFIALFNSFIPVIGIIILSITNCFIREPVPETDQQLIKQIVRPDYIPSLETLSSHFGAGGARVRLFDEEAMGSVRRSALLAISARQHIDNNRLLFSALREDDDEIRILAYSILDLQQEDINKNISYSLEHLHQATDIKKRVMIHKHLALLYQELVYRSLVETELVHETLKHATEHAKKCLSEARALGNEHDPAIYLLLAQIYKRRNELEKAEAYMLDAAEHGAPPSSTIPFLADLAFRKKDYARVAELFQSEPSLRYMQKIGSVAQFWNNGNGQEI